MLLESRVKAAPKQIACIWVTQQLKLGKIQQNFLVFSFFSNLYIWVKDHEIRSIQPQVAQRLLCWKLALVTNNASILYTSLLHPCLLSIVSCLFSILHHLFEPCLWFYKSRKATNAPQQTPSGSLRWAKRKKQKKINNKINRMQEEDYTKISSQEKQVIFYYFFTKI